MRVALLKEGHNNLHDFLCLLCLFHGIQFDQGSLRQACLRSGLKCVHQPSNCIKCILVVRLSFLESRTPLCTEVFCRFLVLRPDSHVLLEPCNFLGRLHCVRICLGDGRIQLFNVSFSVRNVLCLCLGIVLTKHLVLGETHFFVLLLLCTLGQHVFQHLYDLLDWRHTLLH